MEQYIARRKAVMEQIGASEMMILYSGQSVPATMDESYPFEANHHFFYLTGIRRENMALVLTRTGAEPKVISMTAPASSWMQKSSPWTSSTVLTVPA